MVTVKVSVHWTQILRRIRISYCFGRFPLILGSDYSFGFNFGNAHKLRQISKYSPADSGSSRKGPTLAVKAWSRFVNACYNQNAKQSGTNGASATTNPTPKPPRQHVFELFLSMASTRYDYLSQPVAPHGNAESESFALRYCTI